MLLQKLRIKATMKYLVILGMVLLVTIFQDFLPRRSHFSDFNSHPVFLNTFWILVLPIGVVLHKAFSNHGPFSTIHPLLVKRIIYTILASFTHILLFAALVQLLSLPITGQSLGFASAIGFAISMNLYKYLLIYSVIALVLLKKK